MTEEVRKAIDRIRRGTPIECTAETYHLEIRDALVHFALDSVKNNDRGRMRVALAEMDRLDKTHGYGLTAESPDELT